MKCFEVMKAFRRGCALTIYKIIYLFHISSHFIVYMKLCFHCVFVFSSEVLYPLSSHFDAKILGQRQNGPRGK